MPATHLLELINEVLDLARIESGKFTVSQEPVALLPLIEDCLSLIRPLAERAVCICWTRRGCGEGRVRADRTRLKQVLLNLLSNAVKYNRAGGQVRRLRAERDGDARAHRPSATPARASPGAAGAPVRGLRAAGRRPERHRRHRHRPGPEQAAGGTDGRRDRRGKQAGRAAPSGCACRWPPAPSRSSRRRRGRAAARTAAGHAARVLCIEDNPANLRLIEPSWRSRRSIRLLSAGCPAGPGTGAARTSRP